MKSDRNIVVERAKPVLFAGCVALCTFAIFFAVLATLVPAMTWNNPQSAALSNSYVNATSVTCTLTGFNIVGGNSSALQERLWNSATDTALIFPRNFTLPAAPTVRLVHAGTVTNATARSRVLASGDTDVSIRWGSTVTAPRNGSTACTIVVSACIENASQPSTPNVGASYVVTGTLVVRNRSANATMSINQGSWPISAPLLSNPTTVTVNSATLGTASPSAATTYQVAFTGTGPQAGRIAGNTAVGGNTITCLFPTGTVVPSAPSLANVTINGSNPSSITVNGQTVILRVPPSLTVTPTTQIQLLFNQAFGLVNPPSPGTYTLAIKDSAEVGTATVQYLIAFAVPRRVSLASASQQATDYVLPGAAIDVDGFNLSLTQGSVPATVSAVTLSNSGSSPSTVISGVSIYRDNGDGVYGAGDTLLNSTPATFSASAVATVTFDANRSQVVTGALFAPQCWVVYQFAAGATNGQWAKSLITTFSATSELASLTVNQSNPVFVDTLPPTLTWTDPSVDSTTITDASSTVVGGTGTDAGAGLGSVVVKIQRASDGQWWDGAAWAASPASLSANVDVAGNWNYDWDLLPDLQDGVPTYTLSAWGFDKLGNKGALASRVNIMVDNIGPTVASAVALDATHVDVKMSDSLAPTSAAALLAAFTFDKGLSATAATLDADGVTVHLTTGGQSIGTTYTVSVDQNSITDFVGNTVDLPNTYTFLSGAVPNLTVAQGSDSGRPAAEYWVTHDTTAVADEIVLAASGGPVRVTTMTVRGLDSFATLRADVATVALFKDNGDGVFGAGDTLVSTVGTFSADASGTALTFKSVNTTVTPGSPQPFWVVFKTGSAPGNGHEVGSRLINGDVKAATSTISAFTTITSANLGKTIAIDIVPPSTPATAHANPVATGSVEVTWTASTDVLSGMAYYRIYQDGSLVATSAATTATVSGLNGGQTYTFAVSGVDIAGNESTRCIAATVTPPANAIWMTVTTPSPNQTVDLGTVTPGTPSNMSSGTIVSVGGVGNYTYSLTVSGQDFTNTTTTSVPPTMPVSTLSYATRGWSVVATTPITNAPAVVWTSTGSRYTWQQTYVFDYSMLVNYTYSPGLYTTKVIYTAVQN